MQYRYGTAVESKSYDKNLLLSDDDDEEDINPFASHVYPVVNKKDKSGSSVYSITSAADKNNDENIVDYQEVIMWINKRNNYVHRVIVWD